jgi:hypothetical protein
MLRFVAVPPVQVPRSRTSVHTDLSVQVKQEDKCTQWPPVQVQQEDKCTQWPPFSGAAGGQVYSVTHFFRCSRRTSVLNAPPFQVQQEDKCTQWPLSVQVQQEDNMICDSVQVGLESSAYDVGRCVRWMNDYHRIRIRTLLCSSVSIWVQFSLHRMAYTECIRS